MYFVVYTDTDTVSVGVPYWHCVSAAHTQNSFFRSTTTLKDSQKSSIFEEYVALKTTSTLQAVYSMDGKKTSPNKNVYKL